MLLALMDEAYTGSAIEDAIGNAGSDDSGPLDLADPMFLDLLKDENDGIAVSSSLKYVFHVLQWMPWSSLLIFWCFPQAKHWTSPTISSTLQAAVNSPQSDRLKQSLKMAPRFLTLYFATALRDVNDCMLPIFVNCLHADEWWPTYCWFDPLLFVASALLCALIPVVMSRYAAMFPNKVYSFEVGKWVSFSHCV